MGGGYLATYVMAGSFKTTGLGSWTCTGHNTWVLNFITLLYDPKTGAPKGTVDYRESGKVDRDENTFTFAGNYATTTQPAPVKTPEATPAPPPA